MKKNKKTGFTLVELLAVIVILAIILVIAVPKVMSVIEDAKMGTLESTAKMIASAAEKQKVQNTVLGKTDAITCDSVAKINKGDYASCEISFEDNTAKVTIEGSGKFDGLWVCDGTKTSATAANEECAFVYNPIFSDNSWKAIADACQKNAVPETWKVGDIKEMQIGGKTSHIRIIGKNHDTYADGSGTAPLTFQTAEVIEKKIMHSENINTMGWHGTDMYAYLNNEIIKTIDDDVEKNIREVVKTSLIGGTSNIENSSNKLFLLATSEVINLTIDSPIEPRESYLQEGSQYEYYANFEPNVSDFNEHASQFYLNDNPPSPEWFSEVKDMYDEIVKSGRPLTDEENKLFNECFDWYNNKIAIWRLRTPYVDQNKSFFIIEGDRLNSWKTPYSNTIEIGISFAFCF